MRKRDDSIDIFRKLLATKRFCNQLRRMRGAITGRHHSDVVTRADAAVLTYVSAEGGSVRRRGNDGRIGYRELVGKLDFFKAQVVRVDALPGLNALVLAGPMSWP